MAVSHDGLQARIGALIASGDLPDECPQVHEVGERLAGFRSKHRPTCLICREPDATLAYFWIGGRVAYLHAACDVLWKQERERQEGTGSHAACASRLPRSASFSPRHSPPRRSRQGRSTG